MSKLIASSSTSYGVATSCWLSKKSVRGDEFDDPDEADADEFVKRGNGFSRSVGEVTVEIVDTGEAGMLKDGCDPFPSADKAAFSSVGDLGEVERCAFLAFLLFRDASGSFMKTQSLPRDEHLEQGYCRLHLTLDSAQA